MRDADDDRRASANAPHLDDDPAALIGTDVGGYVVECELGRGGMGVVYAATHPMIGKRAAIKVLKQSLSKNPATVERFLQEARSVNQIGHPNIVDIFAFGTLPDGRSYLVMDLLQGEPLRKRVKRGAIPAHEAVQLIEEIASALVAAHDKGFIHRDLKPDNVYLVENPTRPEVKLLDFGLAKLMPTATPSSAGAWVAAEGGAEVHARAYRTATGAMIGTPDYMSPEQLRGTGVDHRTDIYALGVMAFELLTRSRPHRFADGTFDLEGLTFKQALLQLPGLPEELADLVESMVARSPDDRPTLVAVRAVLKRVRPSLQSVPALSGVRAVGSELSIGAFNASNLGARPMVPTPPTGAPTMEQGTPSHVVRAIASHPPAYSGPGYSVPPSVPSQAAPHPSPRAGSQVSGLRAPGMPPGTAATKLGVAPAPSQPLRPHPVAAQRRKEESKTWLIVGFVLVIAATIALVVVLAT